MFCADSELLRKAREESAASSCVRPGNPKTL